MLKGELSKNMENIPMKVWIAKYALTKGIYEEELELTSRCVSSSTLSQEAPCCEYAFSFCTTDGRKLSFWDLHFTREEAVAEAEEKRRKRIESLHKQIEKLENMKFE